MVKKYQAKLSRDYYWKCPRCHVSPGELHKRHCVAEQCPGCGRPRPNCRCRARIGLKDSDRLPCTGEMFGAADCRRLGWYCQPTLDGPVRCGPDEPGAVPDLSRLFAEAVWDGVLKRFVLPKQAKARGKR